MNFPLTAFAASLTLLSIPVLAQSTPDGAALYATHCAACHQPDGSGAVGVAPALAGTLAKRADVADGKAFLSRILVSGMNGKIVSQGQSFNGYMPSFATQPDADLAAIMNHVLGQFNASAVRIEAVDIAKAREAKLTPAEIRKLREQVLKQVGE